MAFRQCKEWVSQLFQEQFYKLAPQLDAELFGNWRREQESELWCIEERRQGLDVALGLAFVQRWAHESVDEILSAM